MQITFNLEDLARLTTKSAEELKKSLLIESDEGEPTLKEEAPSIVAKAIQEKMKTISSDQYSRGKRETMEDVEDWAKNKGAKGDGQGFELLDGLVENLKGAPPKAEDESLTFDALEKNEIAKQWFEQRTEKLRTDLDSTKNEYLTYKEQVKKQQVQQAARQRAMDILNARKWNAGDDEQQQAVRRKLMYKNLDDANLDVTEDGDIVLLDDKGTPVKDDHYNTIKFEDFVVQNNPFGFHKVDPTNDSPSPKEQKGNPAGLVIRDEADYQARMEKLSKTHRANSPDYLKEAGQLRRAYQKHLQEQGA